MKAILLHTAAGDNGGTRRDAGEKVTVGEEADAIALDRAEALVASGSAVEAGGAKPRSRTVPDSASDEAE